MAYQRFSLFPDSPSFKDLFSARSMRYRWRNGDPVITVASMVICVAVWIVETLLKIAWPAGYNSFVGTGVFMPALATHRPWTFITSMFLHQPASLWHILFNMLTLWCVGPVLERMMGHLPYLALYVLSGLGGSAGMMVWALFSQDGWLTSAYGASGALFGLFASILVVYQRIGIDIRSMLIWMLINFLMPIITPNIAWQAHIGGFIVGGVFAWLLVSGLHALRGKSLQQRTLIYGVIMLGVIIAVVIACNMSNPLRVNLACSSSRQVEEKRSFWNCRYAVIHICG